jgi:hypothetical protein
MLRISFKEWDHFGCLVSKTSIELIVVYSTRLLVLKERSSLGLASICFCAFILDPSSSIMTTAGQTKINLVI